MDLKLWLPPRMSWLPMASQIHEWLCSFSMRSDDAAGE